MKAVRLLIPLIIMIISCKEDPLSLPDPVQEVHLGTNKDAHLPLKFLVRTRNEVILVDTTGRKEIFFIYPGHIETYGNHIFILYDFTIYDLYPEGDEATRISLPATVLYHINFTVIPGLGFSILDNRNDNIYFIDFEGNHLETVSIVAPDNHLQNLSGIVIDNALIICETGFNELMRINLETFETSIFKDFKHLTGWLSAFRYHNDKYYLTQATTVYSFSENEPEKRIASFQEYNITDMVLIDSIAYLTLNFEGSIFKLNIENGSYEPLIKSLDYPREIEVWPNPAR